MGVDGHVAMSGKCFAVAISVFLDAAHVGGDEGRPSRVFAEGPYINDGVPRIVVDVGDRIEVDVDSDGSPFLSGDFGNFIGQPLVSGRADGHRHGHPRRAVENVAGTSLEISARQQRDLGQSLKFIEVTAMEAASPEPAGPRRRELGDGASGIAQVPRNRGARNAPGPPAWTMSI